MAVFRQPAYRARRGQRRAALEVAEPMTYAIDGEHYVTFMVGWAEPLHA